MTRLAFLLGQHLEGRGIGVVVTEVAFALARNPDTVRAPDLAFIRQERIPSREPKGFWHGPPDLAVEVVSSEDRLAVVHQKVEEYLAPGVRAVVVIDPAARTVAVWPQSRPVQVLGFPEVLDLDDIIPGFRCGVHRIFE